MDTKEQAKLIDLKVGASCNNHCIHCVAANDIAGSDLATDEIIHMLDKYIHRFGVIDLVLTGGEITLRDDYAELMSYIKSYKSHSTIREVNLQTNGRQFTQQQTLEASINVIDSYLIALHSCKKEEHDHIAGNKYAFDETTRGIAALISRVPRDKIALQVVINRINMNSLCDTFRYAFETFGLTEFNITFPHPMGAAFSIQVTPQYHEVFRAVNETMHFCFANNISPLPEALPYCVFRPEYIPYIRQVNESRNTNAIGYDGRSGEMIDYAKENALAHEKYVTCSGCEYYAFCEGVWREYRILYPDDNLRTLRNSPAQ